MTNQQEGQIQGLLKEGANLQVGKCPGRLRRRWQVWRLCHPGWSLVWRSRGWRWKLVKRGYLPLPSPEAGSPPLKPSDLFLLRRADTTEWEDRHLLHDVWFGVWLEEHPEERDEATSPLS